MLYYFTLFSTISIILPLVVGIVRIKKLNLSDGFLFAYILFSAIIELYSRILFENSVNNMFLFHIHTFAEFFFIAGILYYASTKSGIRRLVVFAAIIFAAGSNVNLWFWEDINEFNSNQRYLEALLLLPLLLFSISQANKEGENNAKLLFSSLATYFIGTLVVFVLAKELLSSKTQNYSWIVHAILNIGLNISLAIYLFQNNKRSSIL